MHFNVTTISVEYNVDLFTLCLDSIWIHDNWSIHLEPRLVLST